MFQSNNTGSYYIYWTFIIHGLTAFLIIRFEYLIYINVYSMFSRFFGLILIFLMTIFKIFWILVGFFFDFLKIANEWIRKIKDFYRFFFGRTRILANCGKSNSEYIINQWELTKYFLYNKKRVQRDYVYFEDDNKILIIFKKRKDYRKFQSHFNYCRIK